MQQTGKPERDKVFGEVAVFDALRPRYIKDIVSHIWSSIQNPPAFFGVTTSKSIATETQILEQQPSNLESPVQFSNEKIQRCHNWESAPIDILELGSGTGLFLDGLREFFHEQPLESSDLSNNSTSLSESRKYKKWHMICTEPSEEFARKLRAKVISLKESNTNQIHKCKKSESLTLESTRALDEGDLRSKEDKNLSDPNSHKGQTETQESKEHLVVTVSKLENSEDDKVEVEVLRCKAESLPFQDSSVRCVLCTTSFHWFCNEKGVKEIHRVLAHNGLLACVWALDDPGLSFHDVFERNWIVPTYRRLGCLPVNFTDWKCFIESLPNFPLAAPVKTGQMYTPFTRVTIENYLEWVKTTSPYNNETAEMQARMLSELADACEKDESFEKETHSINNRFCYKYAFALISKE